MTAIRDDMDNTVIIGVGASTVFVVVFLVFILQAWFMKVDGDLMADRSGPPASLKSYQAEQAEKLTSKAQIPVDKAKTLVLQEISAGAKTKAAAAAPREPTTP